MNTRYAVNRFFRMSRTRALALLASSCCLVAGQNAEAQGCPSATINYGQTSFCGSDGTRMATMAGTAGGTFSSTSGLTINSMSGAINPASSMAGTYMVHYMIPAASGCAAVDATASVTIMQQAMVNPMPNISVCSGSTVNVGAFSSNMSNATFTWTSDNTSIGIAASGSGNIASFTAMNTTDAPQRANVSVYATYTENGVTCMSKPMRFAITVSPVPRVGTIANMTYCSGETTAPFTIPGPTSGPGVRYIWTNDNMMIGLMKSGTDVIPSFTAMNTTGVTQTANITVTPYYNSGERCVGTPTTFTITVNPSPAGTASFSYSGSPYCPSGVVSPTFSGPTGGTFTSSAPGLNLNSSSGNVNTSLSTPGTYTVYYSYANNNGCSFVNTATVTINNANAGISYASQTYCNGNGGMLFPTITGAQGGTFSAAAGLSINASTGAIDLTNSTAGNYTVSYTVNTPSCGNILVQTTVNIIETPQMNAMPNVAQCAGTMTSLMNFIAPNEAGASFSWTNDNPAIGLAGNGSGDIAPFMLMNTTNAPIDAIIRVTPRISKYGVTCFGRTMAYRIRVYPSATVDAVGNQVVCQSAGATTAINFTNSSGSNTGMTYMWTNSNTGIGLAASGTGNLPSFTPSVGNASITVRVTNQYGCTSNPMGFAYVVNNCGTTPIGTGGDATTARTRASAPPAPTVIDNAGEVTTSPNPARSQVTVTYKGGSNVTLRVLDVNGTPVKTIRGFNSSNSVNVSDLRPGNYVIQLVDERKNKVVQRNFIKL